VYTCTLNRISVINKIVEYELGAPGLIFGRERNFVLATVFTQILSNA
jgi:hypothetical protein